MIVWGHKWITSAKASCMKVNGEIWGPPLLEVKAQIWIFMSSLRIDPPPCLHGGHTSHRLLLANDQGWWGKQSRPVKFRTLLKSIFSSRTPGCPGQFKTLLPKHPPFPLSHLRYQTCISPLEEQWEGWGWNPENWLLIKIRTTAITKLTYFYTERVLKVKDSIPGKVNIPPTIPFCKFGYFITV